MLSPFGTASITSSFPFLWPSQQPTLDCHVLPHSAARFIPSIHHVPMVCALCTDLEMLSCICAPLSTSSPVIEVIFIFLHINLIRDHQLARSHLLPLLRIPHLQHAHSSDPRASAVPLRGILMPSKLGSIKLRLCLAFCLLLRRSIARRKFGSP